MNLSRVESRESRANTPSTLAPRLSTGSAFSLVEVMVVVVLLSLIVLALMTVFNSTQRAFRASVTQTDVLEGGRAVMQMIADDLRQTTPSAGPGTNGLVFGFYSAAPVNFYVNTNWNYYLPLKQDLPGSSRQRTNVLENFFVLGRANLNGSPAWVGIGYAVFPTATNDFNALYRFDVTTNIQACPSPTALFTMFLSAVAQTNGYIQPGWSHLLDGVVDLRAHALDANGWWMTNGYPFGYTGRVKNILALPPALGESGCYLFSNTVPATVEIQMGVLEDRALRRASTWPNGTPAQINYLSQQAAAVHIFRQRVAIPNVDLSAYQ